MGVVYIEFDNKLKKSEIVMPLLSSSTKEAGDTYQNEKTDKAQTSVFGVLTPLIMINKTIIDFDAIKYFNIKSVGVLPELVLTVEDRFEIISNIDKPGKDNEVRIQILPKFENAYKKINLTFYITNISVSGTLVKLTCSYKLPGLTSTQYKTFGEVDTYNLFKQIAQDTNLGFATNITDLTDNRYVYCDNKSLLSIMNSEIEFSNSTEHILGWWIDFWDNINLVDIKERYNTVDPEEDMQIWVSGQISETIKDVENIPFKTTAVINDHPSYSSSELFVNKYESVVSPGGYTQKGSDGVYGIYDDNLSDYNDFLVQDGDVKKDIFLNYEYLGEVYGSYNYILAKQLRNIYITKMCSEYIKVTMPTPVLGLMRGHKVNFIRYVNNDKSESKIKVLEENGLLDRNVESNIPLSVYDIPEDDKLSNGNFIIDKTVSAQYLISGVEVVFNNNTWEYILTLIKPASTNVSLINEFN